VPVSSIESNQFKLGFKFGDNNDQQKFFQKMRESTNNISIYLDMSFKIENVVTPVRCTLYIKNFQGNDKITNGFIHTRNTYILK
jgi:hypothetical protein